MLSPQTALVIEGVLESLLDHAWETIERRAASSPPVTVETHQTGVLIPGLEQASCLAKSSTHLFVLQNGFVQARGLDSTPLGPAGATHVLPAGFEQATMSSLDLGAGGCLLAFLSRSGLVSLLRYSDESWYPLESPSIPATEDSPLETICQLRLARCTPDGVCLATISATSVHCFKISVSPNESIADQPATISSVSEREVEAEADVAPTTNTVSSHSAKLLLGPLYPEAVDPPISAILREQDKARETVQVTQEDVNTEAVGTDPVDQTTQSRAGAILANLVQLPVRSCPVQRAATLTLTTL